jgi:hypothetical protein
MQAAYKDYIFHKRKGYLNTAKDIYVYAKKRWGAAWLELVEKNGN